MAYGYYNPYQYQPMQDQLSQLRNNQFQMSPTSMSGTNQDERIWVSSASAAEAYLMTPNSFVRLWDSTQPVFYERRTDAQGRPYPMDIYKYSREEPTAPNNSTYNNNGKDIGERIKSLESRITELEKGIRGGEKNVSESNADDTEV